jgi:ABC-type branched-subunit amino acid transport system ATPase component
MGHLKPAQGTLRFEGADLSARPRHARAALGVGYMPEDRYLVPKLTVRETFCCRYGQRSISTAESGLISSTR